MKKLVFLLLGTVVAQTITAQPPSPEERLKHVSEKLEKELKLSAAQKEKLTAAYREFFSGMEKLHKTEGKPVPPPPPPPPKNKEAVEKLTKARDAEIKSVLTAAQYQKYAEIEKTMRPPAPGGRPGPPPAKNK
jgi:hypothetical protein